MTSSENTEKGLPEFEQLDLLALQRERKRPKTEDAASEILKVFHDSVDWNDPDTSLALAFVCDATADFLETAIVAGLPRMQQQTPKQQRLILHFCEYLALSERRAANTQRRGVTRRR